MTFNGSFLELHCIWIVFISIGHASARVFANQMPSITIVLAVEWFNLHLFDFVCVAAIYYYWFLLNRYKNCRNRIVAFTFDWPALEPTKAIGLEEIILFVLSTNGISLGISYKCKWSESINKPFRFRCVPCNCIRNDKIIQCFIHRLTGAYITSHRRTSTLHS